MAVREGIYPSFFVGREKELMDGMHAIIESLCTHFMDQPFRDLQPPGKRDS